MKFLLEPDGMLKYKEPDDTMKSEIEIIDENVLIYDYTLDELNNGHLVYLQRNGDLNYIVFKEQGKSESKIAKFDIVSNNYYQISILIVKDKLNIFYAYSNKINSSIYALHHVMLNSNNQEMYNIVRFVSQKNNRSFVVDSDSSGNLHIFYNTTSESYSYIFYTYFNPYKNQWLQNPVMLSKPEKKCEYPSILIDSRDSIHSTWWEKTSNGYVLKYKKMNQTGKNLYKWIEINIPTIVQEYPEVTIYEEENMLYIKCTDSILISDDYGAHWNEQNEINIINEVETESTGIEVSENIEEIPSKNDEEEIMEDNVEELRISDEASAGDETDFINAEAESIDINKILLEQILENQSNINNSISVIIEDLLRLNSKIDELENDMKNPPKSGFKKFFTF